jgi:hypothetical protein
MANLSALMRAVDAMLDERPAVTSFSAPAKVSVEALQTFRRVAHQEEQRHVIKGWANVLADDGLVVQPRRWINLVLREPAIEQCAECRLRPGHLEGVGLGLEPRQISRLTDQRQE